MPWQSAPKSPVMGALPCIFTWNNKNQSFWFFLLSTVKHIFSYIWITKKIFGNTNMSIMHSHMEKVRTYQREWLRWNTTSGILWEVSRLLSNNFWYPKLMTELHACFCDEVSIAFGCIWLVKLYQAIINHVLHTKQFPGPIWKHYETSLEEFNSFVPSTWKLVYGTESRPRK